MARSPAHATPGATDANEARHPEALLKADSLQSAIFQTASSSDLIISELKASQEALRASEERFRILFELGPTAAYSCDASGTIREFNRRAAELWGREPTLYESASPRLSVVATG